MKNIYRGIGIGLLIISILSLLTGFFKFIVASIFLPTFYERLLETISVNGLYGKILFFLFFSLYTFLGFWGITLAINLIKKNKYNKQLLFLVGSFGAMKILSFVLYLPFRIGYLKEVNISIFPPLSQFLILISLIGNLIIGILVYVFLIFHKNRFSRIVKGKSKES